MVTKSALFKAASRYHGNRAVLVSLPQQPRNTMIARSFTTFFNDDHPYNLHSNAISKFQVVTSSSPLFSTNSRTPTTLNVITLTRDNNIVTYKEKIVSMEKIRSFTSSSVKTFLTHDIGGDPSLLGHPIPPQKSLLAWEQQCHSLFAILASKGYLKTDELRRCIEALTPQQYESWSYYEKWTAGMATLLLEHHVITHEELQHALFGDIELSTISSQKEPLFETGDFVKVRPYSPSDNGTNNIEWKRPHIRTPGYVYGVSGQIERVCDRHDDPSFLAFGLQSPEQVQLYRVRFRNRDIWPEQFNNEDGKDFNGNHDVVEVEVYEHWLEPATSFGGHDFENVKLFHHEVGDDCINHHHHHHHDGESDDHDHDHVHEARVHVEERAVRMEGPPRPGQELYQALVRLVKEKGIVTSDEIRIMSERMDTAGKQLDGATLVVEAWSDPAFEEKLLEDAASAANEIGINVSNPNAPTVLTVVKNTPKVHNLIVCTLCSCYPSALLGIAPSWYKSREYRARAVREPRVVLKNDFGLDLEKHDTTFKKQIRVHDSTADHRYLVLPERPLETEGWSKKQLRSLITRDTMLGVSLPSVPV